MKDNSHVIISDEDRAEIDKAINTLNVILSA